MQTKLLTFFRWLFFGSLLLVSGFVSCLTAMRIAIRGNEVVVPDLKGITLEQASRRLEPSSLHVKVESRRFDDKTSKGCVISQRPLANSQLKRDQTVRVILSLGERRVPVPELEGESIRAGQILLLRRGLNLGLVSTVCSSSHEIDKIIAQDPLPEAEFAKSLLINILVSSGPKQKDFYMPDLTGMDLESASREITGAGLNLGQVTYESMVEVPRGSILRQSPAAGTRIAEGGTINLEVTR